VLGLWRGVALSVCALAPAKALAGSWPAPEGRSQAILTFSAKSYERKAEHELDLYVEHGLTRRLTLVGGARGWRRKQDDRLFVQAGLRGLVMKSRHGATAVEGRFLAGRDWNECGGAGWEVRFLSGQVFGKAGDLGFIDFESAVRGFSDGCIETRFDVTLGRAPEKGWGLLGQIFSEDLVLSEAGGPGWRVQTQISALYGFGAGTKLQIGARLGGEAGGRREHALVIGLWRRF
jgi:hypothetical protein